MFPTTTRPATFLHGILPPVLIVVVLLVMVLVAFVKLLQVPAPAGDEQPPAAAVPGEAAVAGSQGELGSEPMAPAGPTLSMADPEIGVACDRPAAAPDEPFLIVAGPGLSAGELVVAVDLVDRHGERSARRVVVPASEGDGIRQATVADSADGARFVGCLVTAVQFDDQVVFTGR